MAFVVSTPVRPSTSRFSVQSARAAPAKFCVRAEAEPSTKEEASTSESNKASWAIPEEVSAAQAAMKDFDSFMKGRERKPRTGITFDRENGLMNTWAVEPKMYVGEDQVSGWDAHFKAFEGMIGGLVKITNFTLKKN
eukprot:tig00000792_g4209.t1